MSHFSVLVIGPDPERQLQPYHDFYSTGIDDEFVVDVDVTEEERRQYESQTERRLISPSGELKDPMDDEFFRDPTDDDLKIMGRLTEAEFYGNQAYRSKDWGDGRGYRTRVQFVPEGFEGVVFREEELESFEQFLNGRGFPHPVVPFGNSPNLSGEHKYGYTLHAQDGGVGRAVHRTTLNPKWDWYRIGGRYNGFYKLKARVADDLAASGASRVGRPGIQGMHLSYQHPGSERATYA